MIPLHCGGAVVVQGLAALADRGVTQGVPVLHLEIYAKCKHLAIGGKSGPSLSIDLTLFWEWSALVYLTELVVAVIPKNQIGYGFLNISYLYKKKAGTIPYSLQPRNKKLH